jgi:gas vesicle protein
LRAGATSSCPILRKDNLGLLIFQEERMRGFLFGLGIGIGLGVLFAPMSGEEARNNLSERANDLANTARDSFNQNRDRVQRGVEAIRGTAERAMGQQRNEPATGTTGSTTV